MGKKAEKRRCPKGTGSISVLPDGRADAEFKVKFWDGTERRERKRLPSKDDAEKWLLKVRHEAATDTLLSQEAGRLTRSASTSTRGPGTPSRVRWPATPEGLRG